MSASLLLSIKNLSVATEEQLVVQNVSLKVYAGEIHAIMGPNGSGKSTLVHALMGHPSYKITGGSVRFRGKDLLSMPPHERAKQGLFLAFQHPRKLTGITLRNFLFAAYNAQMGSRDPTKKQISPLQFQKFLREKLQQLALPKEFVERQLNQGFSGGEKKKAEILQLLTLKPILTLLDETDSGLDIDALQIVAKGITSLRGPSFSSVLVTHYARLLQFVAPDHVHVMIRGSLAESGGPELAARLEQSGYKRYK